MVGIAVRDVGFFSYVQVAVDLLFNVVVAAYLFVGDFDVRINLVEFCYVLIQHFTKGLSHRVVEYNAFFFAASRKRYAKTCAQSDKQNNCQ